MSVAVAVAGNTYIVVGKNRATQKQTQKLLCNILESWNPPAPWYVCDMTRPLVVVCLCPPGAWVVSVSFSNESNQFVIVDDVATSSRNFKVSCTLPLSKRPQKRNYDFLFCSCSDASVCLDVSL